MTLYTINENLEFIEVTEQVYFEKRELQIIKNVLILIIAILCFLLATISIQSFNINNSLKAKLSHTNSIIDSLQNSDKIDYNVKNVEKYIDYLPFKDKEFIKRQMRLESNHTMSKVARSHNNLFGMKNANQRFQYGLKGKDYRYYQHWTLSVIDRLEWERNSGNIKTYAQDINYLNKLK